MALSQRYRQRPNIVTRRVLDETLLVPLRGDLADMQRIFALNSVAEYVWARLDGEHDLAALRDDLVAGFEVEPAQAEADLAELIAQLAAAGLIIEDPAGGVADRRQGDEDPAGGIEVPGP